MQSQLGLAHFWSQGDLVSHTIAAILALLSVASWGVIVSKLLFTWRASRSQERALTGFWQANSLPEALDGLPGTFGRHLLGLARTGAHAAQAHQRMRRAASVRGSTPASSHTRERSHM
jgi:biopolymer transport protein ExbB